MNQESGFSLNGNFFPPSFWREMITANASVFRVLRGLTSSTAASIGWFPRGNGLSALLISV